MRKMREEILRLHMPSMRPLRGNRQGGRQGGVDYRQGHQVAAVNVVRCSSGLPKVRRRWSNNMNQLPESITKAAQCDTLLANDLLAVSYTHLDVYKRQQ